MTTTWTAEPEGYVAARKLRRKRPVDSSLAGKRSRADREEIREAEELRDGEAKRKRHGLIGVGREAGAAKEIREHEGAA